MGRIVVLIIVYMVSNLSYADEIFSKIKGVNFPSLEILCKDFDYYKKAARTIHEAGFNHVRLPFRSISEQCMPSKVLSFFVSNGLSVSLDFHPSTNFFADKNKAMEEWRTIWTAVAVDVKNYDSRDVFFELLNEPPLLMDEWAGGVKIISDEVWRVSGDRVIIIGIPKYQALYDTLNFKPDRRFVYAVHYYEPMSFTHQGAEWSSAHLGLKNISFPVKNTFGDISDLIDFLKKTATEVVKGVVVDIVSNKDNGSIKNDIDKLAQWSEINGVQVIINEFGVYKPHAPVEDRNRWYGYIVKSLEENHLGWVAWDLHDGFGLYKKEKNKIVGDCKLLNSIFMRC